MTATKNAREYYVRKGYGMFDYEYETDPETDQWKRNEDGQLVRVQLFSIVSRESGIYEKQLRREVADAKCKELNELADVRRLEEQERLANYEKHRREEDARVAALTPEEVELERLEADVRYARFALKDNVTQFFGHASQIADDLESTAKSIRSILERTRDVMDADQAPNSVEIVTRSVMDELFFLPQHMPERYMVADSQAVVEGRNRVKLLELQIARQQDIIASTKGE